jgi:phosphoenolpyruvate synthase/pyruvate phosphate dikinase
MSHQVLDFEDIDQGMAAVVGGKGANLGELSRIDDVRVPAGFCVTTDAFREVLAAAAVGEKLARLAELEPDDREAIGALGAEVRGAIEGVAMPDALAEAITASLARLGEGTACAVRSSATAEDLPTASFAGQQDTYLNVRGAAEVLAHVSRCWASLFTERAVTYRLRNRFDHRQSQMAVVVQAMVLAEAAGTLFTADPIGGNRKVTSIEAGFGLAEDLVSGVVNADHYEARDGEVVERTRRQEQPVLPDAQVVELARLGRRIEAHFGRPQDIEWCLDDEGFQVVQSRPITTLFPIPRADDGGNHVYVSVGHQQMMTDPMKPLGLSFWQMTTARPMVEAGGRLFVDVTKDLGSPAGRAGNLTMLGKSDPLIGDALRTIVDRGDFVPTIEDGDVAKKGLSGAASPIEADAEIVTGLIDRNQASLAALKRDIEGRSGAALLDFIQEDIEVGKKQLFDPQGLGVIMAGMQAGWWLNEQLEEWLGEKNPADTLAQSAPGNVTAEMGLALLDVADVVRPHPEVVAFLERLVEEDEFLDELPTLAGGAEARAAIEDFLATYGMRCVGEIDIARPRWSERPATLVPVILANVKNFEPGAGPRRFERGREEAALKEREVVARLRALPDGEEKAAETERMIERLRTFTGYREYPKYGKVSRDFVYKKAVMREAGRLADAGVLDYTDDAFYLRFEELRDAVRTGRVDADLIRRRKEEFRTYEALTPPRVLTSDGEALNGAYRRDDAPAGALVGQPVSAGTIEGRARVILDIAHADLEAGDILVTRYTDPSWTPLFVAIAGLVTEVGGLMTHGAVIAREYGLPAIVGVEHATQLIEDGQRIRVSGTGGYVEILPEPA